MSELFRFRQQNIQKQQQNRVSDVNKLL